MVINKIIILCNERIIVIATKSVFASHWINSLNGLYAAVVHIFCIYQLMKTKKCIRHSITQGNVDCISKVIVIVMLFVPWKTIIEKKKIRIIFKFYYATNK
jgi:hypothetical protein